MQEKINIKIEVIYIKLNAIQIFVSDIEKAKDWYSKILGMKVIEEYPEIKCILMKLGNVCFYVETPCPRWGEGWKTVKELKQEKVKIIEQISKRP